MSYSCPVCKGGGQVPNFLGDLTPALGSDTRRTRSLASHPPRVQPADPERIGRGDHAARAAAAPRSTNSRRVAIDVFNDPELVAKLDIRGITA